MPLTKKKLLRLLKDLNSRLKFNNIFLITKQKKYLRFLELKFDNLILHNNFQSNKLIDFFLNH
jgi:hypothetical protein